MPTFNFLHFIADYGTDGARERFEDFVVATIACVRPNVRAVRAAPGDWGIDAFIGDIDEEVAIWQAKFAIREIGRSTKQQIRDSLRSAVASAAREGYRIAGWTLCLPIDPSPEELRWWTGFKRRAERTHRFPVQLLQRSDFERMMRMPESADVRAEFLPHLRAVHTDPPSVRLVPDGGLSDDLLFIRQLNAAGIVETDSAKEQFYNAELVTREAGDKGLSTRLSAIEGYRAGLRSTWEDRFNHHCQSSDEDGRLPDLHPDVMERIDSAHLANPAHPVPLTSVHRKGMMHQVVDHGRAGWIREYRRIAEVFNGAR